MTVENFLIGAAVGFTAGVFGLVFSPAAALVLGLLGFAFTLAAVSATAQGKSIEVSTSGIHVSTPWHQRIFKGIFVSRPRPPRPHHGVVLGQTTHHTAIPGVMHTRTAVAIPRAHPAPTRAVHVQAPSVHVVRGAPQAHISNAGISIQRPVEGVSIEGPRVRRATRI